MTDTKVTAQGTGLLLTRECKQCKQVKLLSDFYARRLSCKACYIKERRVAPPEVAAERQNEVLKQLGDLKGMVEELKKLTEQQQRQIREVVAMLAPEPEPVQGDKTSGVG